jgi:hypothetical protein
MLIICQFFRLHAFQTNCLCLYACHVKENLPFSLKNQLPLLNLFNEIIVTHNTSYSGASLYTVYAVCITTLI